MARNQLAWRAASSVHCTKTKCAQELLDVLELVGVLAVVFPRLKCLAVHRAAQALGGLRFNLDRLPEFCSYCIEQRELSPRHCGGLQCLSQNGSHALAGHQLTCPPRSLQSWPLEHCLEC